MIKFSAEEMKALQDLDKEEIDDLLSDQIIDNKGFYTIILGLAIVNRLCKDALMKQGFTQEQAVALICAGRMQSQQ